MMTVSKTKFDGVLYIELDLFDDERGSFTEAWQSAKMTTLGLPVFHPVQYNVAESKRGVIRGIHAEPWNKYIHICSGEVSVAIVDLNPNSQSFAMIETFKLNRTNALFVPAGFGNSYQATSDHVIYSYLVDKHWSPSEKYLAVHYADRDLEIQWPIEPVDALVSDKDQKNPTLRQVFPDRYKAR